MGDVSSPSPTAGKIDPLRVLGAVDAVREELQAAGWSVEPGDEHTGALLELAAGVLRNVRQAAEIRNGIEQQFQSMKLEMDAIALFLRHHYHVEIAAGHHSGQSLADVVCRYLGDERAFSHGGRSSRVLRLLEGDSIAIQATSCRCGGSLAWVWVRHGGPEMMIGCVCHHTLTTFGNVLRKPGAPVTVLVHELPIEG